MSTVNADLIAEIQERSLDRCVDLSLSIIDASLGIGDKNLSRQDRIARFYDDAQSGALDAMKVIRPDLYREAIRQYVKDVGNSPLITFEPSEYEEPVNG